MSAFTMFEDYCKELNRYDAGFTKEDIVTACLEYRRTCDWIPIRISGNEIGFIIIYSGRNLPSSMDYFIEQVYIQPKYRNGGLVKQTLSEIFKASPGRYGLFILDKNETAKGFWHRMQFDFDLEPITIEDHPEAENCTFYAFKTT